MPRDDGYTTFSIRAPDKVVELINQNALTYADGNRNQYVLSWLPEAQTTNSKTQQQPPNTEQR